MNIRQLLKSLVFLAIGALLFRYAIHLTKEIFIQDYFPVRNRRTLALLFGGLFTLVGIWLLLPKNALRKVFILIGVMAMSLLALESVFSYVAISHGDARSLGERNWAKRYWNSHGTGVIERSDALPGDSSKPRIMILGDSFVAGHGIKQPKDRFGGIIRRRIYSCYLTEIIGIHGNSLKDATRLFAEQESPPDILIYIHIPNDIEDVLPMEQIKTIMMYGDHSKEGLESKMNECLEKWQRPINPDGFFFKNSFFGNFVMMHLQNMRSGKAHKCIVKTSGTETFEDIVLPPIMKISNPHFYYRSEELFSEYRRDLLELSALCRDRNTELLVVLFPNLGSKILFDDSDKTINEPLREFLTSHYIPTLNLHESLKQLSIRELTVNKYNAHPSVLANATAATAIIFFMNNLGKLPLECVSEETVYPFYP